MLGQKSGVAARLQQLYPDLIVWHCLNDRLELAVGDTVNEVNGISHFKIFMDSLYLQQVTKEPARTGGQSKGT